MAASRKAKTKLVDQKKLIRFKTFSESLSEVRIDVVRKVDSIQYVPQGAESYFNEALEKWKELNCSEDFLMFRRDVSPLTQSLHQVIHHKADIVASLKFYLSRKDSGSSEPLLDLLVQLARDVQGEFYPFFGELFPILTSLLKCKDATQIEKVFQCLAYLMKFLWRSLVQEIPTIFSLYEELFQSSQPRHVKVFAADGLAFLIRKVRNVSAIADVIFEAVDRNEELVEGLGLLLFETCKGVQKHLHSNTAKVLSVLISKLGPVCLTEQAISSTVQNSKVFDCVEGMVKALARHTSQDHSAPVTSLLMDAAHKVLQAWSEDQRDGVASQLQYILHLIGIWVSWRNGALLSMDDHKALTVLITAVLEEQDDLPSGALNVLFQLFASILMMLGNSYQSQINKILKMIYHSGHHPDLILPFTRQITEWNNFTNVVVPELSLYVDSGMAASVVPKQSMFAFATALALELTTKWCLTGEGETSSRGAVRAVVHLFQPGDGRRLLTHVFDILAQFVALSSSSLTQAQVEACWCALVCLSACNLSDSESGNAQKLLVSLVHFVKDMLDTEGCSCPDSLLHIWGHCLHVLVRISAAAVDAVRVDMVVAVLRKFPSNFNVLAGSWSVVKASPILFADQLEELLPVLKGNIISPFSKVKLTTLEILCALVACDPVHGEGGCAVLGTCVQAERLEASLSTVKKKNMCLEMLRYRSDVFKNLPQFYTEICLKYLCGVFYFNFSPLWPTVTAVIVSYAVEECKEVFWSVLGPILTQASVASENFPSPLAHPRPSPPGNGVPRCEALFAHHLALLQWSVDSGRTDHLNFRFLLWKLLERLPDFAERRSKVIVPVFLDFLCCEFTSWEETLVDFQSILDSTSASAPPSDAVDNEPLEARQPSSGEVELMDTSSPQCGEEMENKIEEGLDEELADDDDHIASAGQHKSEDSTERLKKKTCVKTLKQMLTVFTLFKNPKGLSQHETLLKHFYSLLMHRDSSIQQLALKCVATYKQPGVSPYIDSLLALLEDREFNTVILQFSSTSDQYIVKPEHCPSVIPVLLRLLNGRMLKHGEVKLALRRRGVILRFLETCRLSELKEFVGLVLAPFSKNSVLERPDPSCVVPLKKQQGILKLCGEMLVSLKADMLPHAADVLHVALKLTSHSFTFLAMRNMIVPYCVKILRSIRQLGMDLVTKMFKLLPMFSFAEYEDRLFECAVWPQLAKLPQECIQAPTPLMKLFLQWSFTPRFHPYFTRLLPETALPVLHYVYSCLFAKGVSFKITDLVFQMTLNLLQDMEQEQCQGYTAVQPHVSTLLLYINQKWAASKKKMKGHLSENELKVLVKISPVVTDADVAVNFVEVLLKYVSQKAATHAKHSGSSVRESAQVHMLKAVKHLISVVSSPLDFLRHISGLFSTVSARSAREELCSILQAITKEQPRLKAVADTVSKLNSWSPTLIDEPDYIARIHAFSESPSHLDSVQDFKEVVLLLLNNAMFFLLTTSDLSIRDGSAGFVFKLIAHENVKSIDYADFTIEALYGGVLKGLRSQDEVTFNEVVAVLGKMVMCHKDHPKLEEMVSLSDPDPEADFFENVRHIQIHRRTRAFLKVESLINKLHCKQATLIDIFLPLTSQVITSSVVLKEHNLLSAAIAVLGAVAGQLKWFTYKQLLMKYLQMLTAKPAMEKILLKVVVAILNAFHFTSSNEDTQEGGAGTEVVEAEEEEQQEITQGGNEEVEPPPQKRQESSRSGSAPAPPAAETSTDPESAPVAGDDSPLTVPRYIHDSIVGSILPEINTKLVVKEEYSHSEVLRAPLVLAMTKLLQSLPKDTLHSHLPRILVKICAQLKNRDRDTREMARRCLVKIADSLGAAYVPSIVREMRETLTKGYQIHILGFSMFSLLSGLSQDLCSGDLDPCREGLTETLLNDLFGSPEEERDAPDAVKKLPEAKSTRSYESLEIFAAKLSPKEVPPVVEALLQVLKERPTAKVSKQVAEGLRKVSLGVAANAGFTLEHILLLVHKLMADTLTAGTATAAQAKRSTPAHLHRTHSALLPEEPRRGGPRPTVQHSITSHTVTHFSLQLTLLALRKHNSRSQRILEMVDPFVETLTDTIQSKHISIITVTLNCLRELLSSPLPALKTHLPVLIEQVFSVLGKYCKRGAAQGANQELVTAAFKTMTAIVKSGHEEGCVSQGQLQLLLTFVEEDIHDPQRQSTAFPLLKAIIQAIIDRKLAIPEIHDVMDRIIQLSVVSESDSIRSHCITVVCQFLLTYRLDKKKYKYFAAIVSNLNFEVQSGRESVLEILSIIFSKFSLNVLKKQASFFFLPLSIQLVNDSSPVCKEMVAGAMKKLLLRVDRATRSELAGFVQQWMSARTLIQQQVGAQVLKIFIEVEGEEFHKRLSTFWPLLFKCLGANSPDEDDDPGDGDGGDDMDCSTQAVSPDGVDEGPETADSPSPSTTAPDASEEALTSQSSLAPPVKKGDLLQADHLVFTALSCFGKVFVKCPSVFKNPVHQGFLRKLWSKVESLLLHPHMWVRLSACKLFGLLFAAHSPAEVAASSPAVECAYLTASPGEKATDLFYKFYKIIKYHPLDPELSNQIVKNMVYSARVVYQYHRLSPEEDAPNGIAKLIARMDKLARVEAGFSPKQSMKRLCVLKWIGAVAVTFDSEEVGEYLALLLKPVYRELSNEQTIGGDCYKLAEEVMDVLGKTFGRDVVAQAHASVQTEFLQSREKRKRKLAIDAVANPEVAARRKIRKNVQKKLQRKAKRKLYKF